MHCSLKSAVNRCHRHVVGGANVIFVSDMRPVRARSRFDRVACSSALHPLVATRTHRNRMSGYQANSELGKVRA